MNQPNYMNTEPYIVKITRFGKPFATETFESLRQARAYCMRYNRPRGGVDPNKWRATIIN